jgi:hypothetical protein
MDARTTASIKKLTDALEASISEGLVVVGNRITMYIRRSLSKAGAGRLYYSKRSGNKIVPAFTIAKMGRAKTNIKAGYRYNEAKDFFISNKGWKRGYRHRASVAPAPPAPDTETLRNSISFEVTQGGGYRRLVISSSAPYSKYMEIGTFKVAARPFIRPAIYKYAALLGPEIAKAMKFNFSGQLAGELFKNLTGLDKIEKATYAKYVNYWAHTMMDIRRRSL